LPAYVNFLYFSIHIKNMSSNNSFMKIAKDIAKPIFKIKHIEDVMLYGSLARNELATDIDLMLIGDSKFLDLINCKSFTEEYSLIPNSTKLTTQFKLRLAKIIKNNDLLRYHGQDIADLHFLDSKFFSDFEYRIDLFKKLSYQDPFFFYHAIMRDGLLYNQDSERFNIPARSKYDNIIQKSLEKRKEFGLGY
jgi:predicted nucleotidyltransferase